MQAVIPLTRMGAAVLLMSLWALQCCVGKVSKRCSSSSASFDVRWDTPGNIPRKWTCLQMSHAQSRVCVLADCCLKLPREMRASAHNQKTHGTHFEAQVAACMPRQSNKRA